MEWLIGFAIVDIVAKLDFVTVGRTWALTQDLPVRNLLLTMRRLEMLDRAMKTRVTRTHNILGLICLVNISMPQRKITLGILRVTVVEVYKKFLRKTQGSLFIMGKYFLKELQLLFLLLTLSYRWFFRLMTKYCIVYRILEWKKYVNDQNL